jgi:hypothetical protein
VEWSNEDIEERNAQPPERIDDTFLRNLMMLSSPATLNPLSSFRCPSHRIFSMILKGRGGITFPEKRRPEEAHTIDAILGIKYTVTNCLLLTFSLDKKFGLW